MPMKLMRLTISNIRLDFQPAENRDEGKVQEYVARMQNGDRPSPIRVRFDGSNYFCEDGFHRLEAARRVGLKTIQAEIRPGTLEDMETEFREYLERLKASLKELKPKKRR
jgi:hypothetical protein